MTADEAASVIALWQQEQTELTGLTDKPAVPDVAEGLDISVADVQRLLQAVRAQRLEEEYALGQEQDLANVETQLAEEEARLADIQRQRAEVRPPSAGYWKKGTSRRKNTIMESVPWEVWKAAQAPPPSELAQAVDVEWDVRQEASRDLTEPHNLKGINESAVLRAVWTGLIIIFFVLLICWKQGMP